MPLRKAWTKVAIGVAVLAILIATLRPGGSALPRGWSFALASGDAAFAELIQNLLLFIPLGVALALAGIRPLRAIAIGAGLSFTVEFIQQWLPGRDPSAGDIVCNAISTAIGVGLVRTAPRWLTVAPRRAAWQSLGTALAAVLVWLATGLLLRPVLPPPPYHDVWTPAFAYWGQYQGKVLAVSFDSLLPLSEGTERVRVTGVAAPRPPSRAAPLVAILDGRDTKVLIVAVDLADIALDYHTRADALTLMQPDLRWHDALAHVAPGDTFTVQVWRENGVCLAVNTAQRCGFGYTIGDGWKLIFYPEHFPPWAMGLLNALWVGGWMLGVGYWAGRAGRAGRAGGEGRRGAARGGVAIGLAILGLSLVPALTGLKATPMVEWMGALGGMGGGYWTAVRYRARITPHGASTIRYTPPPNVST